MKKILLLLLLLQGFALAGTMSISSIGVSQDGYSGLSSVVAGRSATITATLSGSATVTSWNLAISPSTYTVVSQPATGSASGSASWAITFSQKADYSVSITPSCSASDTCSGNSKSVSALNPPNLDLSLSQSPASVSGGSSLSIQLTLKNLGEADARGVKVTVTGTGANMGSNIVDITQPGYETGTIAGGSGGSGGTVGAIVTVSSIGSSCTSAPYASGSISVQVTSANGASDSTALSTSCSSNCYSTCETPSTPSSSPSGAPAAAPSAVKETKSISSIAPSIPAIVNITKSELSVSELKIEVKNLVSNVSVSVEKLDSKPASITTAPTTDGKIYKYLDITSSIPAASLSKVKIKFKVESTWISSNNFSTSTVYLNRYSSGWSKLPTSFLNSDSKYSYFESESPGFSTFAITGEKPAVSAPAPEQQKPPEEKPVPVEPTPTGFAPVVSLITQADIDNALKSWNSVVPQTDAARSLLEEARLKISEAQTAFNNKEQARAKQLVDEARLLIDDAAGIRSAAVASGKTSIFTILLILVVLAVGVYAYYARPAPRADVSQLAKLRKEKDTIVQMKKTAEKEYLSRKIDQSAYKSMLADYEGKLIEVNTRIDELSRKNN